MRVERESIPLLHGGFHGSWSEATYLIEAYKERF